MSATIAIVNQKGGVGKTTTAVNLASSLASRGKSVLLMDLDPQGNATSGLGLDKQNVGMSSFDVLVEHQPIQSCIQTTAFPGLSIVPANSELVGAEAHLLQGTEGVGKWRLTEALRDYLRMAAVGQDKVVEKPHFILFDCPPSLGLLTLNALIAARSLLIPVQCEYYALEGLAELFKTFAIVQQRFNPGLVLEGILLTMFDTRTALGHQVEAEIRQYYKEHVFRTVIPRTVRLSEAPSFGKPILAYDPKSRGSESYLKLSEEVIEHEQERARTRALRASFGREPGASTQDAQPHADRADVDPGRPDPAESLPASPGNRPGVGPGAG